MLTFLSWLINKHKLTPKYTPLPFQMKMIWVVALTMTIVTFSVAVFPEWSWQWTIIIWKTSLFCFVMVKVFNTAKRVELYYVLALVWFVLLAIWGIQQKFSGNARMEGLGGSVLPDVNYLAAVYVLYFPMAYYSIFSRKQWIKFYIGIPSFIIFVIFILFGESRGAFLGLSVCMALIFLRAKGIQKIKLAFTTLSVGLLLVFALWLIAPKGFWDKYTARLSTMKGEENVETGEVEREGSSAGRIAMWKGALFIYRNHPEYWWLGVGMNCYRLMYYQYHKEELYAYLDAGDFERVTFQGKGEKDLHNTYINVLMGGGAIVLLLWLFLIFYAWRQAHNIPRKYPQIIDGVDIHNYARAIEIGIVGYCVCIMFLSMEFIDFFYWHLTMAGVIANLGKTKLKREELGQEEEEFIEEPIRSPAYSSRY